MFTNNLYQVLLGVYLCQRWIVEFKGIMQPVLFMIFFLDFVTPQIMLKIFGLLDEDWFHYLSFVLVCTLFDVDVVDTLQNFHLLFSLALAKV